MTLDRALQLALQHHRAGRLAEAEPIYRQVLARQPDHPDALHLLGLIAHQVGRHADAKALIERAIESTQRRLRALRVTNTDKPLGRVYSLG